MKNLRITCTDLETGESDTVEISHDNYLLICGADRYLDSEQVYATGTAVLTVKTHKDAK